MSRLVRLVAVLGLVLGTSFGAALPAVSDDDPSCGSTGGLAAGCTDDGEDEDTGTEPDTSGPGGGGGPRVCSVPGYEGATPEVSLDEFVVDCETADGVWSDSRLCYLQLEDPQPPRGDDVWEGNDEGYIIRCTPSEEYCNSLDPNPGAACVRPVVGWEAEAPPILGLPDPEDLAREAFASLGIEPIDIGIVPEDGPDQVGLIGMPVWMWAASPDDATMGPDTATAEDQGLTVTIEARVDEVVWDMGDGTTVTCTSAGTPFADRFAGRVSPDCGHRYTRAGEYEVTATTYWSATWQGGNQEGELFDERTATTTIRVAELQVLVD